MVSERPRSMPHTAPEPVGQPTNSAHRVVERPADQKVTVVTTRDYIETLRIHTGLPPSYSPQSIIDEGLPALLAKSPPNIAFYEGEEGGMVFSGIHPQDWPIARALITLSEMPVGSSVEFQPVAVRQRREFRDRLRIVLQRLSMTEVCIVFYLFRSVFVVRWADPTTRSAIPIARLYDITRNKRAVPQTDQDYWSMEDE